MSSLTTHFPLQVLKKLLKRFSTSVHELMPMRKLCTLTLGSHCFCLPSARTAAVSVEKDFTLHEYTGEMLEFFAKNKPNPNLMTWSRWQKPAVFGATCVGYM